MKVVNALEGGLAGATTISLLSNTLRNINGRSSHINIFEGSHLRKRLQKASSKKPLKSTKQIILLAGDLLASTGYLGIAALGKKKNAMLRGGLLGTAAGLGAVLLNKPGTDKKRKGHDPLAEPEDKLITKALEVSMYTIGGLIAGRVIEGAGKKKKNKRKKG